MIGNAGRGTNAIVPAGAEALPTLAASRLRLGGKGVRVKKRLSPALVVVVVVVVLAIAIGYVVSRFRDVPRRPRIPLPGGPGRAGAREGEAGREGARRGDRGRRGGRRGQRGSAGETGEAAPGGEAGVPAEEEGGG